MSNSYFLYTVFMDSIVGADYKSKSCTWLFVLTTFFFGNQLFKFTYRDSFPTYLVRLIRFCGYYFNSLLSSLY